MSAPIGVFDSGVGGLTVLRALRSTLPAERFVYLGDTARLPYGTKSASSVVQYSLQCAAALVGRGIRCLVVACNTASASALCALRLKYPHLPIIGVVEPGANAAVAATRSRHVAVIGTEGTVSGGAYEAAIRRLDPGVAVTARPCSLFVAMAEEGWVDGPIAEAVAHRYLDPIFHPSPPRRGAGGSDAAQSGVPDTLVLGCTHFPALSRTLREVLPAGVALVDSAATVAAAVSRVLSPSPAAPGCGGVEWLATDGALRFARVSRIFLGEELRAEEIEIIDL